MSCDSCSPQASQAHVSNSRGSPPASKAPDEQKQAPLVKWHRLASICAALPPQTCPVTQSCVQSFCIHGFVLLRDGLYADVLHLLQQECSSLYDARARDQLLENGCVLEPFVGGSIPEDHLARSSFQPYRAARATAVTALSLQHSPDRPGASSGASLNPQPTKRRRTRKVPALVSSAVKCPQAARISHAITDHFLGGSSPLHRVLAAVLRQSAAISVETSSAVPPCSLSPRPLLFNEHYVVKPPQCRASSFAWHTDGAEQLALCMYEPDAVEYVSLWCPLDDVDEHNGTLVLWPRSAPQSCPPSKDARGALPAGAVQVEAPAGSVVLFSSKLWHCSFPNLSECVRRVYYSQWSSRPIKARDRDVNPLAFAVPLQTN